jgi:hypothetical protein
LVNVGRYRPLSVAVKPQDGPGAASTGAQLAAGTGGTLSCSGLEALWESAGGSPGTAFMVAEIAAAASDHFFARIMKIRLRGRGRRDVPISAFDDGRPITLRLIRGEILRLVGEPVSVPEQRLAPRAKVIDGGLAIGPGLIGRDQIITYTLLA